MWRWTFGNRTYTDSTRLSPTQYRDLIAELSAGRHAAPESNRRANARKHCEDIVALLLDVEHPGGANSMFITRPSNISRGGVGFFHGNFLYARTKVLARLIFRDGEVVEKKGKIARCRHVKAHVHEIGIAFDEEFSFEPYGEQPANQQQTATT